MSRFHGIADVSLMGSADFMAAADRLPYYEGAVTFAMRRVAEDTKPRAMSGAELQAAGAARDGWAPVFEVDQVRLGQSAAHSIVARR